ncbi:hypothetical protein N6H18_03315 [Reichenbachiella agarivorans]|uniref:Ser/Thr protein kinase RdoA involved in Cpx stress response, MazF antagonist n=1 Tax=Reichenbachiella agarivorans TaxID=2979464 RepID=A0ABY6CT08_9BACT|nr:hypothetical protein [Reichenbachiella agarivorans]UXP32984.1 hypothetical protein N6H18_03315 [Reichenbachiella agarivorans]
MTRTLNFNEIVLEAWSHYDDSRKVVSINDISARVSTNHVFKLKLETGTVVIGKLSYFGTYANFMEDHALINSLAINLSDPYDQFISRSLTKGSELFTYRYKDSVLDAWVVFYNPIKIKKRLPKILDQSQIKNLGREVAKFHKACFQIKNILPPWSKTLKMDLDHLLRITETEDGQYEHRGNIDTIKHQIDIFNKNMDILETDHWPSIPVFVDWNIGNFSLDKDNRFYSRWDYDWFRMSSRIMDFYFFSRVCSTIGDREEFSYLIDPVNEDRFILFLKEYHKIYPLTRNEVLFIKEAYRFFILNYVIKDGRYFFHEIYATKLQREAYEIYLPQIDQFDGDKLLRALDL